MKTLFVPLHMTGVSCNGMELEPDKERLVRVPDDQFIELQAHGLLDPEDEKAMQAYSDSLDAAEASAKVAAATPRTKPTFHKKLAARTAG